MNTELLMLVLKYHAGQTRVGNREDGKTDPQIEHLFRVFVGLLQPCDHYPHSLRLVRQNAAPLMLDVALAHDILEDTDITEEELVSLSIKKGSLNDDERSKIQKHIIHTKTLLNKLHSLFVFLKIPSIYLNGQDFEFQYL